MSVADSKVGSSTARRAIVNAILSSDIEVDASQEAAAVPVRRWENLSLVGIRRPRNSV